MNLADILSELRSKRDAVEEAIMILERLAREAAKRRERPINLMTRGVGGAARPPAKGRTFSAESRQRMAEAQRKRWAAKREEAK